jgi:SPP1 family predicted phage head-tail adaptor
MQSAADHRITLAYDSLTAVITSSMRITYGGKRFDISSPPRDLETAHKQVEVLARVRA